MANKTQPTSECSNEANDTQMTAEDTIRENLRFYSQGCEVPADALKKIMAGRIKGMSDVNPMWRMKKMTEIFGPVGFGWRYEIVKLWTEAYGNEVKCFCNVNLYVRDPETKEWSAAIPGNGGSSIVSVEKNGPYVNDEGYKMALTDALSIAMKPLGIGGNVWYGPKATGHNESKYEAAAYAQPQPVTPVFTGAQLTDALAKLEACKTVEEYHQVWAAVSQTCPALCQQGSDFYKACIRKNQEIQQK